MQRIFRSIIFDRAVCSVMDAEENLITLCAQCYEQVHLQKSK